MGGSISKVGRRLPTKARTSGNGSQPISRPNTVARKDIKSDGENTHLLANLSQIGQVDVQSVGLTTRTANHVSEMYRKRDLADLQATSTKPIRNRLAASSLSTLLDDQKFVRCRSDLEHLAVRYKIDLTVLEGLVRFVNSPNVAEGTVVRSLGDDGQERITMQAVWTDPALDEAERLA